MQIEIGEIYEGKITGLTKFGAFVEFGQGKKGMVHISEIASTFVKEITDFVSEGQEVKVKVISISDDGKIALSMKKAEDPKTQLNSYKGENRERQQRPNRLAPRVYQPKPMATRPGDYEWQSASGTGSFEDMMSKFKQTSEEKISDLKRITDTKRGGHSRRDR